jgi:ferrochelatase
MKGLLLINLGTPNSPSVTDVRKYLRQFLFDPYVIDINPIARWLLLNLIILPLRPKKSAHAYQSIWTAAGSPLLVNSQQLADNAQKIVGSDYQVILGMRYGKPSIESAVKQFGPIDELVILPLFPQYSLAATESAIQAALTAAKKILPLDRISVIKDFYDAPKFISAQAELISQVLSAQPVEKLILSYHGLPERQSKKCDYRAQCYATSQALAKQLELAPDFYCTTFQSRLGRTPWIKPFTDEMLIELAAQGIKRVAVACPSFVCDCLETLEEIGMRAQEQWLELGGEQLILVPCVNGNAAWVADLLVR